MKKYILALLLAVTTLVTNAQDIRVSGRVISSTDKEPLIGVTVKVSGSSAGAVTDLDGRYTLNAGRNTTLSFSMVGFQTQEVKVNGRTEIDVELVDISSDLNEVVVIGYGAVKKGDLTSSISAIKGDKLERLSTGNVMNALQGQVSGVQIAGAGSPGATPRVIIRGVSTINGSEPLYVVDGMPVGTNINFLNQNDIETMQVLKDASAAAIYGTRGSNGVILITTKKGAKGNVKFNITSTVGLQTLTKQNMAGAAEYEHVFKARYINDGNEPNYKGIENITNAQGTDWWNETLNKTAVQQNYNFSFSGGTERLLYSANIGYFRQNAQYKVGEWQKLTARFSMEYAFNKIAKAGIDFTPKYENWHDTPGLMGAIMAMDPTTPVMRDRSEWTSNPYSNYARSNNNQEWNPVASMYRLDKGADEYGLLATPYISITPIEGLTFRTQFGLNARFRIADTFNPNFFIDNLEQNSNNNATRKMENWVDWNWTNTLTWMKTFAKKHNFNVMAGYTMERFQDYWAEAYTENIPSNVPEMRYVSAGTANMRASGTNEYSSLISYLGRLIYNYDERYYLTASVRIDGSSKFPIGQKYATFPSFSAAWRITGESFMQQQRIFSDLKLRAGWGRVGNQNIDNSVYISSIGAADYVFGTNADRIVGTAVSSIGNSTVKWETVEDYNIGADMSFLDSRLKVTLDWFTKTSHDMLMRKANLLVLGYPMWNGQMWENIGSMRARGWEIGINWMDKVREVNYGVGLNLSSIKNKALKLMGEPIYTGGFNGDYIIRNEEGKYISQFYGYVTDGLFQNETEVRSYTNEHGDALQPNARPGDIRYLDLNNDGKINEKDKTYIGNPFPDLMIGLNLNASWRNIDFLANFYGTMGNDIFNNNRARYSGVGGQNIYAGTYNKAWHGEGTSYDIPRLSVNDANMNYKRPSTFFVEDGSYFRCKLLQVGYKLPAQWLGNKISMRLSFSAQNLFTITGYSGADPETASLGRSVTEAGIDYTGYPNPRTFLFGLNLSF